MIECKRAVACLALVNLACVGAPTHVYPGPERPLVELAVLRQTSRASVMSLDHEPVSGAAWAMPPGWHDALLRVRIYSQAPNMRWTVWTYCRVRFKAIAGREYESVVRVTKETAPGLAEKLEMEIGIVGDDGTLVGKAHSCSGERPSTTS